MNTADAHSKLDSLHYVCCCSGCEMEVILMRSEVADHSPLFHSYKAEV